VVLSDAHFGVAFTISRRAPLQGFARRLQTSQELFEYLRFSHPAIFCISPRKSEQSENVRWEADYFTCRNPNLYE